MSDEFAKTLLDPQVRFQREVKQILAELEAMLVEKNRKYGDAALNPKRIFATASPAELIRVRMDDKLSRIANRQSDDDEDPNWDLMGYLVLERVAKLREAQANPKQMGLHTDCQRGCVGSNPQGCKLDGCIKLKA